MALSQCLEDSPAWRVLSKGEREVNLEELYNERHRLALEELLSGGVDSYLEFLKKEKIPNFLSDEEIKHISLSAVVPKAFSVAGDDAPFEHSVSSSMDCSSVTYFPDVSDVEPPVLELGWPAFTTGSFRGVTRAVAHFQPSYGDCIYSCKDAARKMIKGAKELIAIVTDSLTDLDIFRDLQEACTRRRVPVYILLDQVSVPSFLQMCSNLSVRLEELRLMRVRTITGCAYYMRSGARITGKVHERFMLIDGHKVATGSYRFNWTDGKLNTSNLIELTGQITEKFDEEFRILYAQSLPLNARECPFNKHNSGIFDHLLLKLPSTPPIQTPKAAAPNQGHMTSTPTRAERMNKGAPQLPPKAEGTSLKSCPNSDASTLRDEWMKQDLFQDELVCEGPAPPLASAQPLLEAGGCLAPVVGAPTSTCHISTQTGNQSVDKSVQTDRSTKHQSSGCSPLPSTACTVTNFETATSSASSTSSSIQPDVKLGLRPPIRSGPVPMPSNLKESFRKLSKERQGHYASIRSKLDNMMTMLSHRRELVDLTNLALSPGLRRRNAHQQSRRAAEVMMETTFTGTWPRSRALQ